MVPRIDDWHHHLRDGDLLRRVIKFLRYLRYVNVMPNPEGYGMPGKDTPKGILNAIDVSAYGEEIETAIDEAQIEPRPKPLLTIKITPLTTPDDIYAAHEAGAIAGKTYPNGVTTNSVGGVHNLRSMDPVLNAMANVNMVNCIHVEKPGALSLKAEYAWHNEFRDVAQRHPTLRFVFEHITDRRTIPLVLSLPNAAATVTLQHMRIHHDDVVGTKIHPHNFCRPLPKWPADRDAIREFALSGHQQCILGTDSAPHWIERKECAEGCAGVFTAPITLPLLVETFEEAGKLKNLRAFACENGARFYRLPFSAKAEIELVRQPWTVPLEYNGIVPFMAGQELQWQVVEN